MKKETKLQRTKSNNFVHIPKIFIDNLGWLDKEELILEYKEGEIVIKKKD